jgi:hypothetical protein
MIDNKHKDIEERDANLQTKKKKRENSKTKKIDTSKWKMTNIEM